MGNPYLPDGVSESSIPGMTARDTVENYTCSEPAKYAPLATVYEAVEAALSVLGQRGDYRTREAVRRTLHPHVWDACEIDPKEECGFDGEVDVGVEGGVGCWECPKCLREQTDGGF